MIRNIDLESMTGRLVRCEKVSGHVFVATLIRTDGAFLVFKTRSGRVSWDRLDTITHISEVPEKAVVE